MDHVVEFGNLVIGIGNHREVELGSLSLLDVFSPALV
jgi:hypothetical protein